MIDIDKLNALCCIDSDLHVIYASKNKLISHKIKNET